MRTVVERGYHRLCLTTGRLLRSARYATTRLAGGQEPREVRKRRHVHAPLLVWLAGPLLRLLDVGVRVLPQARWSERERRLWRRLHGREIRVETDGTLVLPCLAGDTLAAMLEDPARDTPARTRAIALAVGALAALHHLGITHADAMAENVMVDLDGGVAHWFDFETVHGEGRPLAWCRADDLRALLATVALRTPDDELAATVRLVIDAYGDETLAPALATTFGSSLPRPLLFHLGQAGLSFRRTREIARLVRGRSGE